MKVSIELSETDLERIVSKYIGETRNVDWTEVDVRLIYRQAAGDKPREIAAKVSFDEGPGDV